MRYLGVTLLAVTILAVSAEGQEALGMTWTELTPVDVVQVVAGPGDTGFNHAQWVYWDKDSDEIRILRWDGSIASTIKVADEPNLVSALTLNLRFVTGEEWVVMWKDDTTNDLMYSISTDDGDTWGAATDTGVPGWLSGLSNLEILSADTWVISSVSTVSDTIAWTTDGGSTWTYEGDCNYDYSYGSNLDFRIFDVTGGPNYEVTTFTSADGCTTVSSSITSGIIGTTTQGMPMALVGPGLAVMDRDGEDNLNGIWMWEQADWALTDTGYLLFNAAGGSSNSFGRYTQNDNVYMITADGDSPCNHAAYIRVQATILTGCTDAVTGTETSTDPVLFNNIPIMLGADADTLFLWVGEEIVPSAELLEPAEFDSGLVVFAEDLGFKTTESKLLFVLIMTGITLTIGASMLKIFPQGRWTNFILLGLSLLVGVFAVLIQFIELWAFTLALVLGATVTNGGKSLKDTYAEVKAMIGRERELDDFEISGANQIVDTPDQGFNKPELDTEVVEDEVERDVPVE